MHSALDIGLKLTFLQRVLRKYVHCAAEKTYFRTMECWKYLDKNSVGVMEYMINIGITIEEIEEIYKEKLKKKTKGMRKRIGKVECRIKLSSLKLYKTSKNNVLHFIKILQAGPSARSQLFSGRA